MDPIKPVEGGQRDMQVNGAHIGKSVTIRGELSGSENLYVDGEVEGSIHLDGHSLTIGQNGRIRAEVKAKDVVVQGRIDGNVSVGNCLDLRKNAVVIGDLQAQRIAIEDGAFLKGKIETTKSEAKEVRQEPKPEPKPEPKQTVAVAAVAPSTSAPVPALQGSGMEPKR